MNILKNKSIINLLIVIAIFYVLLSIYTPIFETNDDSGMSMIAHGYGLSMHSSPYIMFSNIVYGYIVTNLPMVNGIYPYSYMTFFALFVVCYSLLMCFDKLQVNKFYTIVLICIIFTRAIAMPQFTVNAGLLAIASLIAMIVYANTKVFRYAILGAVLAFYSYLIRNQEFYFVYIVGLPFLLNKNLLNKNILYLTLIFICCCIGAEYLNAIAYHSVEFNNYNALAKVRAQFNDFGASEYFINRPEILAKYDYTANDMILLRRFIFADPILANPTRMAELLSNFKLTSRITDNLPLALQAIKSIYDDSFKLLIIVAIFGMVFSKSKLRLIAAWIIFVVLIGLVGLLGRPSVLRVYYPIVVLLTLLPFINCYKNRMILFIGACFILVLCVLVGRDIYQSNQLRKTRADLAYSDFNKLGSLLYYVQGASLPYEYIYLPLRANISSSVKLYAFGSAYYLPNTVSNEYAFSAQSFGHSFESSLPINVIMSEQHFDSTEKYCQEHYHKHLNYLSTQQLNTFTIYQIVCK